MPHRPLVVLLLAALTVLAPGCVKFRQTVTVMPDGSGKMDFALSISEQTLAMADGQDPFADFDPQKLAAQENAGWAAFTEPDVRSEGGFKTVRFTGYFRDINAVTLGDLAGGAGAAGPDAAADDDTQLTTYSLTDGRLTVRHGLLTQLVRQMAHDESMGDPATRAMMAPMVRGLEIHEGYVLPGPVTEAEGYRVDGPAATLTVDADDLLGDEPFTVAAFEDGVAEIAFEGARWSDRDAWEAEFAAAEATWAELKRDAETVPAE